MSIFTLITKNTKLEELKKLRKYCREKGHKMKSLTIDNREYLNVKKILYSRPQNAANIINYEDMENFDALIIPNEYPEMECECKSEVCKLTKNFVEKGKPVLPLSHSRNVLDQIIH
jgi:hypothetical protein